MSLGMKKKASSAGVYVRKITPGLSLPCTLPGNQDHFSFLLAKWGNVELF